LGSVADADVAVSAEVTPAVEARTLFGPAVAVVAAVTNVLVATVSYATEDRATDQTGDNTTYKGSIAAALGFSSTSAHGYGCTDRQSGNSGGEGLLSESSHFPFSYRCSSGLPRLARGIAASLDDGECSGGADRRMCGNAHDGVRLKRTKICLADGFGETSLFILLKS
jgi:hypothetical protein